ncbi:hypothetical protein IV203_007631 [Nitzschia inconspicua]|uniref:Uncharacterized protein n=1 Tax=Nitzschia inconspicua TaxID=303405 RepID=A0A9K3PCK0_9STRA|nr:hypothetical protein IV203_007631 [Nitzschia inconspicua]
MNSLLSPSTLLSWEPNFSYSFFFDHICNAVNNNDQDDQHNIKNAFPRITYSHTPQQLEDNDNNDEQRDAPPSPCSNPKETIRSSGSCNPTSSPKSNPSSNSPKSSSSSRRRRRSDTTITPKMPRIETVLSVTDFIRMDHDESSLDYKSEWNNSSYFPGHASPTESLSSLDTAVTEATTVSTSSSCGSNDNTSSTTTTTKTIPTSILKKSKYTTTENKDDDDDTRDVRPTTTTTIPPKRKHNNLAASVVGHLLFSHSNSSNNNNNNNKSIRFAQTVKPAAPTAMYTRTLPTRRQKKRVKIVSSSSPKSKNNDAEQTALLVAYLQQEGLVTTAPVCDNYGLSSLYASTKTPLITLPA